ncbi:MAG: XRE family transcriptional regulator [Candidatus Viridilinea halotolerans]|uniref:XRE family transcriptional regulator n=1 Tax=Candidatus Viridilinea halotolerans TaxID=2491704 RepID=A0A426U3P4_9CHLR|nr:MAG: XRE family transcriptional regulator [Candidatus Viridilinea halotolerans]
MSEPISNYHQAVGIRIREVRLELHISQTKLATMLDVTCATVSRWESGVRGMSVETLLILADVLGIPASSLLPKEHQYKQGQQITHSDQRPAQPR